MQVDQTQFHLGSSDSASDIVIFNSSSGLDIINQFNSVNGDIMKYTGNLSDQLLQIVQMAQMVLMNF